jgi:hypothetical protein
MSLSPGPDGSVGLSDLIEPVQRIGKLTDHVVSSG